MSAWDQLVEAKIRDWEQKRQRGEKTTPKSTMPVDSIETQLFSEIVELRRRAGREKDSEQKREHLDEAERLRVWLAILLERAGLPLLADSLEKRLQAELLSLDEADDL